MARILVAAFLAALAGGCAGERASPDTRTVVRLTAEQRNMVLTEMRTMLGSVDGVLGAAARSDSAGVRAAALASGMAAAADPAIEKLLPAPWLALAGETHGGFDSLAARAGKGRDTVLVRIGRITTSCVGCHAMYQIVAQ